MQLTVLGAYGGVPGTDGACPGYLVEADGMHLLLDCGNGVVSRLQRYCRIDELDAVVVSHLHWDHIADLFVMHYALQVMQAQQECFRPLPLHMPGTPPEVAHLLDGQGTFAVTRIEDGMLAQLGSLTISLARMAHSVESYAVSITAGEHRLVYSGDTAYHPRLVEIAQEADLFLCEATAVQGARTVSDFPHLYARQAADIAARAGVRRLLLTHYWYETPREEYAAEARQVFPQADVAEELVTYTL